ncbi:hypothetical protein LEMA_P089940.1 [Plenodomus lingam JN3]|uniref:Protein phosphatase 4 core regulatory subunit R2 n=1 Tax=Leptosphaeria maculans (strain JN3 / isolate v23.1.3 / race Av1-4-5-6-7-8) TaxID=985895 RepID=E5A2F0_LEPMJ|nr:hypothetical protein LEMA_P089940.1 [Plenodomus lingam JN3]CBX97585.1 hypothetical protein LEMA_P089940.1 [Plenodomus lingam JN3]
MLISHAAEAILRQAADDGSLDSAEWPKTLQYILDRLDEPSPYLSPSFHPHLHLPRTDDRRAVQIVNEFPKPPTPAPTLSDQTASATTDLPSRPNTSNAISSQESHATDKENAPPDTPPRPPVPAFAAPAGPQTLPQDIANFYASIRTTLSTNFAKHPPHTVQRLAELVLEPRRRYRYLPAYLRAIDRVISVSSPLTLFPLPQAVLPTAGGLLNGTAPANSASATLGSDESLGGALLTPIPWLQNRGQSELISESTEMVDGPNGAGRIETVTVGMLTSNQQQQQQQQQPRPDTPSTSQPVAQIASSHPDGETLPSTGPVTQGELLRQEQEAGSIIETVEADEEIPHARGPDVIGMEDTGPQRESKGLNIEGAIGRPSVGERTSKSPGAKEGEGEDKAEEEQGGDAAMKEGEESAKAEAGGEVEAKKTDDEATADVEMKSGG